MPQVSVIIPVYKVEPYIADCARSQFGQTLDDIEYVFVDDCSPDKSMDILNSILEEFPERKSQVRILRHETNLGITRTRKDGFDAATGDYIIFCDSDDWVDVEMYSTMMEEIRKTGADMVFCEICVDDEPQHLDWDTTKNCRTQILKGIMRADGLQLVTKIMARRSLYERIPVWPPAGQGEDLVFSFQLAYFSSEVRFINKPFYHWRTVESSMTHNSSSEAVIRRFNEIFQNVTALSGYIEKQPDYEELRTPLVYLKLEVRNHLRPLIRRGECVDKWRSAFPEIKGKVLTNKWVSFRHKVEYLVTEYLPSPLIRTLYAVAGRNSRKI